MNLQIFWADVEASPLVGVVPRTTDYLKLVGVDEDEVKHGIHNQEPPHGDSHVVPVASGDLQQGIIVYR